MLRFAGKTDMSSLNLNLLVCTVLCVLVSSNTQTVHRRFEYKYSFKPPYLAQKDGSVPFWEYGGNAIASGESVRLAPSLRSQKGAIWTKNPINFDWWEVDVMFKISGRGRIGADGLAFWYTTQRGEYTGDVFGSSDRWNGLGVIFDSFDNDNKHNNPYIMAVVNDGTKNFDHKSDGSTQLLSGCLRDFRNKPYPTRARIEYYLNTLTVYFHNGLTNNEADYELCFRAENVVLPRGGYLGLSAATGGLADDHDVVHLLTTSLHTTQQPGGQQMSTDEQQKLSQEYQEYQKKLEQQKEDYRKEHPDEVRDRDGEMEDWFESDGQRELRQIFQGLGQVQDVMRDLHKKVDEVIGKQMNSLSMLTAVYSHTQGQPLQPAQPPQPGQVQQMANGCDFVTLGTLLEEPGEYDSGRGDPRKVEGVSANAQELAYWRRREVKKIFREEIFGESVDCRGFRSKKSVFPIPPLGLVKASNPDADHQLSEKAYRDIRQRFDVHTGADSGSSSSHQSNTGVRD